MQQCEMWACREFMWLSERGTMEKGNCSIFFLSSLLWRGLKKSKRRHFDNWAAPVGKIAVYWEDSFSHITEKLCPAASPPRLQTSWKCINIEWSPLPPIEPSVLPVLCMSFTCLQHALSGVFRSWCSIACYFPEDNYQILFPIFK